MAEQTSEAQKLKSYFDTESASYLKYRNEIGNLVGDSNVPTNNEKKPDIDTYVNNIVTAAANLAGQYFGDGKNPDWTLGTAEIFNILKGFDNPVEGGKLRDEIVDRIKNAYFDTAERYVVNRGAQRSGRVAFPVGKQYGESVATQGLESYIANSGTPEILQLRLPTTLSDSIGRKRQVYGLTGKPPV